MGQKVIGHNKFLIFLSCMLETVREIPLKRIELSLKKTRVSGKQKIELVISKK